MKGKGFWGIIGILALTVLSIVLLLEGHQFKALYLAIFIYSTCKVYGF